MNLVRKLRRRVLPNWTDRWPEIVASTQSGKVAHLGSGQSPLTGSVTVDINETTNPDVLCDLNRTPWPLEDNAFDGVVAISILEHLDDFLAVMAEIHRITKHGAVTSILVPHFSAAGAFVDPTHRQHLSGRSCDYFIEGTPMEREFGFYVPFRFALVRRYVHVNGVLRYLPGAEWLATNRTAFWEDYLCFVLRGGGIFWQLRTIKSQ